MKVAVAIVVVACALSVVGLGVTVADSPCRALSDEEMQTIVGRIGDGCACKEDSELHDMCDGPDGCRTCRHAYKEEPDGCPDDARVHEQFMYITCVGGTPEILTCHNITEDPVDCLGQYTCKQKGIVHNDAICIPWGDEYQCAGRG